MNEVPLHPNFMGQLQSRYLQIFMEIPFDESHTIPMKGEDRRQFVQQMIKYYELHIPNFHELKAFAVLQMVMS